MKNVISLLSLALLSYSGLCQTEEVDYQNEINKLESQINVLRTKNNVLTQEFKSLDNEIDQLNERIDTLSVETRNNSASIDSKSTALDTRISSSESATNEKFNEVDESFGKTTLYSIIGVLIAIILTGVLYFLLSRRQQLDKSDLIEKLSNTKSSIEESLVKEFGKQAELMEAQIKLMEGQTTTANTKNEEIDHSLALRVADEITLIERNISLMDPSVKGLKQLSRSVSKLRDNLMVNGYEIPELLGKNYDQGMKVIIVGSATDDNLETDVEIISKVIKPQVNFQNQMIQTAQIETSKGI